MSTFDALLEAGATYERQETSKSSAFAINGIPIQSATVMGVRYEWILPGDSGLQVVFVPESFGKTVIKIFKKELQTGDGAFDDTVYIDTDDKAATAALLESESIRDTIFGVIAQDGRIAIDGNRVVYELAGGDSTQEQADMAALVEAVMQA